MKSTIFLLISIFSNFWATSNIHTDAIPDCDKKINPISPKYKAIDSVIVEYFDAVGTTIYTATFDSNSITVSSSFDNPVKVIKNPDTVRMMINYVESLFIYGTDKTEIGRSYVGTVSYGASDKIKVKLFMDKKNYLTHEIYYDPSSSIIEFSPTFLRFNEFLKDVIDYK